MTLCGYSCAEVVFLTCGVPTRWRVPARVTVSHWQDQYHNVL